MCLLAPTALAAADVRVEIAFPAQPRAGGDHIALISVGSTGDSGPVTRGWAVPAGFAFRSAGGPFVCDTLPPPQVAAARLLGRRERTLRPHRHEPRPRPGRAGAGDGRPAGAAHHPGASKCGGTSLVVCDAGTLGAGASETMSIMVYPGAPRLYTLSARLSSPSDTTPQNNVASGSVNVVLKNDVTLQMSASPQIVGPARSWQPRLEVVPPAGGAVEAIFDVERPGDCRQTVAGGDCTFPDVAAGKSLDVRVIVRSPAGGGPFTTAATIVAATDKVTSNDRASLAVELGPAKQPPAIRRRAR